MHFQTTTTFLTLLATTFISSTSAIPLLSRDILPREIKDLLVTRGHDVPQVKYNPGNGTISINGTGLADLRFTKCYVDFPKMNATTLWDEVMPDHKNSTLKTLASPAKNTTLSQVLLGVGSQNYTCTHSIHPNGTHVVAKSPIFQGARSTLYDASCLPRSILQDLPQSLVYLPSSLLNTLALLTETMLSGGETTSIIAGKEWSTDNSTSIFHLKGYNSTLVAKVEERVSSAVMNGTNIVELRNDAGVDWVRFSAQNATVNANGTITTGGGYKFASAYRVATAGGKPPSSCDGYPKGGNFEVPYAAQYLILN